MSALRDFNDATIERIGHDSLLAAALLNEALTLFLQNEAELARLVLRDLVKATMGFEELASKTHKPSKSLHRMLSARGNPSMDNLTCILNVLRRQLGVDIKVQVTAA